MQRCYAASSLLAIVLLCLTSLGADAVVPSDQIVAQKVLACYRASGAKSPTIEELHNCSGVWVTPRALLMCAMQANHCPVFSDTLTDRASFYADLKAQNLTISSVLNLPTGKNDLPPLPSKDQIESCRQQTKNKDAFVNCVLPKTIPSKFSKMLDCFAASKNETAASKDRNRSDCVVKEVSNPTFTSLLDCVGKGRPTADKLLECGAVPQLQQNAEAARNCVKIAPTKDLARDCLVSKLDPAHSKLIQCLAKTNDGNEAAACLDEVNSDYRKARVTVSCLKIPGSTLLSCSGQVLSGPSQTLAACLVDARTEAARLTCGLKVNPELSRGSKSHSARLSLPVSQN
jgi:hypothetical protein